MHLFAVNFKFYSVYAFFLLFPSYLLWRNNYRFCFNKCVWVIGFCRLIWLQVGIEIYGCPTLIIKPRPVLEPVSSIRGLPSISFYALKNHNANSKKVPHKVLFAAGREKEKQKGKKFSEFNQKCVEKCYANNFIRNSLSYFLLFIQILQIDLNIYTYLSVTVTETSSLFF